MKNGIEVKEILEVANTLPKEFALNSLEIDKLDSLEFTLINENNTLFINAKLDKYLFLISAIKSSDTYNGGYLAEIYKETNLCDCDPSSLKGCSDCNKIGYKPIAAIRYNNLDELTKKIKTYVFLDLNDIEEIEIDKKEVTIDDIDLDNVSEDRPVERSVKQYEEKFRLERIVDILIPISIPANQGVIKMEILNTIIDGSEENDKYAKIVIKHLYEMRKELLSKLTWAL